MSEKQRSLAFSTFGKPAFKAGRLLGVRCLVTALVKSSIGPGVFYQSGDEAPHSTEAHAAEVSINKEDGNVLQKLRT